MRILLACLLLISVGCGDDDSSGPNDGGAAGSGATGSVSKGGSGAGNNAGSSGKDGGSGMSGGSGKGGSGGGGGTAGARMGKIKLVPNVIAGKQTGGGSGGVGSQQSALRIGTVSATTLLSLKYYVTSIQLCEDAELMGSGFSNLAGCIQLYQNMPAGSPDYNEYTVPEAMADTTAGRYVDLMSAEGQAALRQPVTLQVPVASGPVLDEDAADGGVSDDGGVGERAPRQAGVYRYGLINFYRPIKVKAEFPILGETSDHYFRTKAVTAVHEIASPTPGGIGNETVSIGDTLSGATEETTYMLNNGGALFVFQKPFAITQADVDAGKEINIDLVFNPENFGQAYETNCSADVRVVVCDPSNNVAIDMPFVRMNPVPRKTGEKTRKETYLLDWEGNSKVRVELYYNDADPEAGVQGVDTAIVYPPGVTHSMPTFSTIASNFVSQSGSVTTNDASVSLLDYRRWVSLEGLRRRQAGTATLHCIFPGGFCPSGTVNLAYTYVGDSIVSGN